MSGGQKQRVSLARAVYTNKDIYLLDDILRWNQKFNNSYVSSAVDQHVGKAIFGQCIAQLLRKKIILFVTNQLQYLPSCDLVLLLQDGRISGYDKYKKLIRHNPEFQNLMKGFTIDEDDLHSESLVY